MKKYLLILTMIIFTFSITGCSTNPISSSFTNNNINLPSKDSITQADIDDAKNNSIPEVYAEMKEIYNIDDKDMAIYYKKIIALNKEFNENLVFNEYDKPYAEARSYCTEVINHALNNCDKEINLNLSPNENTDNDPKNEREYKLKIYNSAKNYSIEPKVFFIVRDRLTRLPIYAGSKDFQYLKSKEGTDETTIDLPVSECELISSSVCTIPYKFISEYDLFFLPDTKLLSKYPDKDFAKENGIDVIPVVTGTIINDNTPKLSKPNGKIINLSDNYIDANKYFKKGTRVVVRSTKDDNYLVTNCLGNYAWVKAENIKVDNPEFLSKTPWGIHNHTNKILSGINLLPEL